MPEQSEIRISKLILRLGLGSKSHNQVPNQYSFTWLTLAIFVFRTSLSYTGTCHQQDYKCRWYLVRVCGNLCWHRVIETSRSRATYYQIGSKQAVDWFYGHKLTVSSSPTNKLPATHLDISLSVVIQSTSLRVI